MSTPSRPVQVSGMRCTVYHETAECCATSRRAMLRVNSRPHDPGDDSHPTIPPDRVKRPPPSTLHACSASAQVRAGGCAIASWARLAEAASVSRSATPGSPTVHASDRVAVDVTWSVGAFEQGHLTNRLPAEALWGRGGWHCLLTTWPGSRLGGSNSRKNQDGQKCSNNQARLHE